MKLKGVILSWKPPFDPNFDMIIEHKNRVTELNIDLHKSQTARFEQSYLLSAGVFERGSTIRMMNGDKTMYGILELWKRAKKGHPTEFEGELLSNTR